LDDKQKSELVTMAKVCSYQIGPGGSLPGYMLSNLRGNINRDKKRLEEIERRKDIQAEAEAAPGGIIIKGDDFVNIIFAEKPDREILDALRAAGFRWGCGNWGGYREKIPACVLDLVKPDEEPAPAEPTDRAIESNQAAINRIESELRESWNKQGVPQEKQDAIFAEVEAKSQPGAHFGPFIIGESNEDLEKRRDEMFKNYQPEVLSFKTVEQGELAI
jgi:hypothetical protein